MWARRSWFRRSERAAGLAGLGEACNDIRRAHMDHWKGDDYQFLQRSIIRTTKFQDCLPRLPIPPLKKSCDKYLAALRPFLNNQQYETAKKLVADFLRGSGARLNRDLSDWYRRNEHTSYITEPWFDMYFRSRDPLPINYNPFLVWKPLGKDQLSVATNLIISSCRFKRSLEHDYLKPEIFHFNPKKTDTKQFEKLLFYLPAKLGWLVSAMRGAYPLDMSQYRFLFNTSRIPVMVKDQLSTDRSANHVVIMRRGHFYSVELFDETGKLRPPSHIHACLDYILNTTLKPSSSPIGLFTTMEREQWSLIRSQLLMIEGNEESIQKICGGLFVLNLDDLRSVDPAVVAKNFLHSDGTNRWFDKSMQLIVFGDGLAGVNFEHSWGDGVAVLRFMEDVAKDISTNQWITVDQEVDKSVCVQDLVQKLDVQLDKSLEEALKKTEEKYKALCGTLDVEVLQKPDMNRTYLKSKGVSPDAMVQIAIQVAFNRMHGHTVPTYESCSTAAFKHGRTETIRPATVSSQRFVNMLLNEKPTPSAQVLKAMLVDCSKMHSHLVKQAAMGQGFDRHIFAMKALAERRGDKLPDIYLDETYRLANRFVISTSSLSSDHTLLGGFGPVVPDGYGIGYIISNEQLACLLTAYSNKRDAAAFMRCLDQSLNDIKNVLDKA